MELSTKQFTFHKGTLVAEISDFGKEFHFVPVASYSSAVGFVLVSGRTGVKVPVYVTKTNKDRAIGFLSVGTCVNPSVAGRAGSELLNSGGGRVTGPVEVPRSTRRYSSWYLACSGKEKEIIENNSCLCTLRSVK
jgi:hypothetical protein